MERKEGRGSEEEDGEEGGKEAMRSKRKVGES